MSSFLNSDQLNSLTSTFQKHFETFSSGIGNVITVYKEPIKQINNINVNEIFGYNSENNPESNINYIPVYKDIYAQIIYPKDLQSLPFLQIRTNFDQNDLLIKVDKNGADYLNNGKNEKVVINSQTYNIQDHPNIQNFFGLKFYYYKCTITN